MNLTIKGRAMALICILSLLFLSVTPAYADDAQISSGTEATDAADSPDAAITTSSTDAADAAGNESSSNVESDAPVAPAPSKTATLALKNGASIGEYSEIEIHGVLFTLVMAEILEGAEAPEMYEGLEGFEFYNDTEGKSILIFDENTMRFISVCQVRTKKILNLFRRKAPDSAIWSSFLLCNGSLSSRNL